MHGSEVIASWFCHLYLGGARSLDNLLTMSKVLPGIDILSHGPLEHT